ncbi:hypothetical protein [Klebsiella phage phiKp_32]|nr:hypothetical protein [Klebsiella phage phiKp_32]
MILVTGCSHKTTVSEANTKLQVEAQAAQVSSMGINLQQLKEAAHTVPKELVSDNPVEPISQLIVLDEWLKANDCLDQNTDYVRCYKLTRLKLITTTRDLDNANDLVYASQVAIKGLLGNIDQIVDQASGTVNLFDPKFLMTKAKAATKSVVTKVTSSTTTEQK